VVLFAGKGGGSMDNMQDVVYRMVVLVAGMWERGKVGNLVVDIVVVVCMDLCFGCRIVGFVG
jgi:hypothetical protein